jgi:hypothetical protein
VTEYKVDHRFGKLAAHVLLYPRTGRTHQLRVHLASLGHPILGDQTYGGRKVCTVEGVEIPRVMLHARTLGFRHPVTGESQEYTKPFPSDMEQVVQTLTGLTPPHAVRTLWQTPQRGIHNVASKDEFMQTGDVLDAMGGLVAQLKTYAAKLPPIVHLSAVPTGVKPKFEAVEEYEEIVSRFRNQSAGTPYKGLNELLVESLEAFEVGRLLGSVHPLLSVLDHLERMGRDKEIEIGRINEMRTAEYRSTLNKILPGNKPELDGAGRGMWLSGDGSAPEAHDGWNNWDVIGGPMTLH